MIIVMCECVFILVNMDLYDEKHDVFHSVYVLCDCECAHSVVNALWNHAYIFVYINEKI